MPDFDFSNLAGLLRRSVNDSAVRAFLGPAISHLTRDEYYGSIDFKGDGVETVFKEAPWVVPKTEISDPKDLYLSAFHLHRAGHDGYGGYAGQLQNGVRLGDAEAEVVGKLGQPAAAGGGGMSSVLKTKIPRWLKYPVGDAILHLQFDADDKIEMATLHVPDLKAA
jgi:hypothetical protein